MPSLAEFLKEAEIILRSAGIPEPAREAASLLQFAIARDRTFVIAHPEYPLTKRETEVFESAIRRRAAREPFQYIVGKQEFFGLDFIVTPDVLIPRPETEILVERAIEILESGHGGRILEIGVGSGCISVAILKNCPKATAMAVDVSELAIEVALRNASMHGVDGRLTLVRSDVYSGISPESFDLIVSNPPYVPESEIAGLQPEVRDHEPNLALTDGFTGLTIVERIVAGAFNRLSPHGYLLIEVGFGQSATVREMLRENEWSNVELLPDLQGIPRIIAANASK
jgi:release factor glutamine methyltransferase